MYVQAMSIAPPIQAVLDLFDRDLAEVRFGDIDAQRLSALASDVQEAAQALETHEAGTAKLRAALAERQEALLQQAQRALAFARIHAEDDPALSAKVAEISLPRAAKRAKAEAPARAAEPAATAVTHESSAKESVSKEEPAAVAEAPSAEEPAPSNTRRGKRREATRVVARDDEAFDAPAAEA